MRALLLAACAFLAAITPVDAQTRGIHIAPVVVDMRAERGAASIRVRNGRPREAAFEIGVFAWGQANGRDVLTPTADVLAAPGVFAVSASGGEQIVRLALAPQARGAVEIERAYRIIVRELPPAAPAPGFRVLLEMSLPLFVTPQGAAPALEIRRIADTSGAPAFRLMNRGSAHARLADLTLLPDASTAPLPRYLLAGADFVAPLPANTTSARLRFAPGNADLPIEEDYALEAPADLADLR